MRVPQTAFDVDGAGSFEVLEDGILGRGAEPGYGASCQPTDCASKQMTPQAGAEEGGVETATHSARKWVTSTKVGSFSPRLFKSSFSISSAFLHGEGSDTHNTKNNAGNREY